MSIESAFRAMGVPGAVARREAQLAEAAMIERQITTQRRAQAWLAQVAHESARLVYFEEIASGAAYEGRRDLGNTQPGDGRRFKGRGPIQLTGRANYREAGEALSLPLESNPTLASQHRVGWRIAAWFWQSRGLNALADQDAFVAITKRINGGTNGLPDRQHLWAICKGHDCCPSKPDPLAGYTTLEVRWIREYDDLKHRGVDVARRKVLRRVMTTQRRRVWRAAQDTGWERAHRRRRYESLLERTR